jgi:DNA-binding GntR family transcriptional regulator
MQRPSYQSKVEAVEEYLRAKLRSGEIPPGERLRQDLLAEQLGVSSTPVREALRRLEAEGLVVHVPNKGVTAREAREDDVLEIFPLRILLEGYATRLATSRLTERELESLASLHHMMAQMEAAGDRHAFSEVNDRWHWAIYRAAGSKLLEKTVRSVWRLASVDDLWTIPGRAAASVEEHERILEALRARNGEKAEMAMAEHLRIGQRFLLDFIAARSARA